MADSRVKRGKHKRSPSSRANTKTQNTKHTTHNTREANGKHTRKPAWADRVRGGLCRFVIAYTYTQRSHSSRTHAVLQTVHRVALLPTRSCSSTGTSINHSEVCCAPTPSQSTQRLIRLQHLNQLQLSPLPQKPPGSQREVHASICNK